MKKTYTISTIFIIGAILFWGVPVLSGFMDIAQTVSLTRTFLEVLQPCFCAVSGFLYTRNASFTWYLPVGIMLLFLPVCIVYYPLTTIVWVPIYGVLNLVGCIVANFVKNKEKSV